MRIASATGSSLVLGALLWVGARGVGPLPPAGPLLDPANGALALSRTSELPAQMKGVVPGLAGVVTVTYDDRGVPHISATSMGDAYRAMGWVVARDRLFQMELQVRAAAGTVSEFNARALAVDTTARRIGLAWGAERRYALLKPGSKEMESLEAYTAGVNAYIDQMRPSELPIEYRLVGRKPLRWHPKNAFYFLARMSQTLSFILPELNILKAQLLVGRAAAEQLYAVNAPIQEPIVPNGQRTTRFDLAPLPPPGAGDSSVLGAARGLALGLSAFGAASELEPTNRAASNNWVVGPKRTKAGFAILAGDPHLELSLPSIWYEVHLVVPGQVDAYGYTFAGTPSIVLGFNRDVAWSATNTGADVADFYKETVDDALNPTKYQVDGEWRAIERKEERYRGPAGEVLRLDTLRFTHRGPLRKIGSLWLSMRWTALDTNNANASLGAFQAAQTATSVATLMAALAPYPGPAQNFVMADRAGNIGIRSTGLFPIRPADGSGLAFRDGSTSASDWTGYWAVKDYPQSVNPSQGFLASANQQPVDPRMSARYFGAEWPSPWRAMRINQRLRSDSAWTPNKIRLMQVDSGSARADFFVPYFLDAVLRLGAAGRSSNDLARTASLLAEWSRSYTPSDKRAVLFEAAMDRLSALTWDELVPRDTASTMRPRTPGGPTLARLLRDPTSPWWDDRRTLAVESRDDILAKALTLGFADVVARHGRDPNGDDWRWANTSPMKLHHLLRIDPFSALNVAARSGPETIAPRAIGGTYSASERLVVEMGPTVHAWTTYPGGQSGNPFSSLYKDRLVKWAAGRLDTAIFGDVPAVHRAATLTLVPEGK